MWKKSHKFVLEIYKISALFPKDELYGLTSQIRRASVSIPANIAEGFSRRTNLNKTQFYNIAQSSLQEVKYYLILMQDLGFVSSNFTHKKLWDMSEEIGKMLHGLKDSIERNETIKES